LNDACLGIVGGDAPIAGAKYKSFTDPVVDGGKVVCIAALTGTPKPLATVVLGNLASQTALEAIAQAGGRRDGGRGEVQGLKRWRSRMNTWASLPNLPSDRTAPKTTAANDLGLGIKDGSGPLTLACAKGRRSRAGGSSRKLVSFVPGAGSPGQGRGWLK